MATGTGDAPTRIRIKGRTPSVVRFFLIAVSYMIVWITLSSELGYYSKLYGPQVFLQLNIAFYLPSIPVLLLSGPFEKWLDTAFGATYSMLVRLQFGIFGCFVICAAFPFFPENLVALLTSTVIVGAMSAIAFSTSYQLVSWFRNADTIALGLGCVGAGPIVLLIQLFLGGSTETAWQWITMFELSAGFAFAGLVSTSSLIGQYWPILTGEQVYEENKLPLLGPDVETEPLPDQASGPYQLPRLFTHADPFQGLFLPEETQYFDDDAPLLYPMRRAASWDTSIAHGQVARIRSNRNTATAVRPGRAGSGPLREPQKQFYLPPAPRTNSHAQGAGGGSAPTTLVYNSSAPSLDSATAAHALGRVNRVASDNSSVPDLIEPGHSTLSATPFSEAANTPVTPTELAASPALPCSINVVEASSMTLPASQGAPHTPSFAEEAWVTLQGIWPVAVAFTTTVTILNLVFPFFTYVPTSGLMGDSLPKVLFFTRIFSDMTGRMLPRIKACILRKKKVLLAMALTTVPLAVGFFLYIKAPHHYHHDVGSMFMVIVFWLLGGYINTVSNVLAPNLVEPALATRASALMALAFQIAHFAGLILAIVLQIALYGHFKEG